jgi:hypothetical protein
LGLIVWNPPLKGVRRQHIEALSMTRNGKTLRHKLRQNHNHYSKKRFIVVTYISK